MTAKRIGGIALLSWATIAASMFDAQPGEAVAIFLAKDGQETAQWKKWGDDGDRFVKLSGSSSVYREGRSSLRVEIKVVPGTSWWPSVGFDFPLQTRWANVGCLELWLRPESVVPEGLIHYSLIASGRALSKSAGPALQPGQWHHVTLRGDFTKVRQSGAAWRLKVAVRPGAVSASQTFAFCVDGLRLLPRADRASRIAKLKDLCLTTSLVERGQPKAVLVAPPGERYAAALATVQAAVRQCAGIELPVHQDARPAARELLGKSHVIALGNMATNAFIEKLYCEWYTMTDLWYPGKGGYEVRSLHNPYATGHNVIFLGGSDDAGVAQAAKAFASLLRPGDPLQVGRLMEIKLGRGMDPPKIGETVYTWHDSFRKDKRGNAVGYAPATYFAWNPISVQAALYYMTGRKEYMEQFKRLALPDPKNVPVELRTDSTFYNPLKPLVENYHYRVHLVDVMWDLIEESPLFSDAQRLAVTNELLEHQNHFDANDTFTAIHGSRHGLWHMNCIYTGSRYFAKYYPDPRWEKRLANARRSFASFINDPTWGELDTLGWVNTSMEPVFDFFLLDGYEEFVRSGTARTMVGALEILWSGKSNEESNRCQSLNLMRKAAYVLKDGRYLHMADAAGYDMAVFRVGQSFAPPSDLPAAPPLDRVGRVSVQPLARHNWQRAGKTVPLEQAFQFLSYRSGCSATDDFVQIDGFYGRGRNPYHVNALYALRMGGNLFLNGYGSQVSVRCQGMVEPSVAAAAALEAAAAAGHGFYTRSTVPDMPFSSWTRHVLYVQGIYAIVADEVRARQAGRFDVSCGWGVLGKPSVLKQSPRCAQVSSCVTVACSTPVEITTGRSLLTQEWSGALSADDRVAFGNLLYRADKRGTCPLSLEPLAGRRFLIDGTTRAVVCFEPGRIGGIDVEASAAYVSQSRLFAANATSLACGRALVQASKPVCVFWDLAEAVVEVDTSAPVQLRVLAAEPEGVEAMTAGVPGAVEQGMARLDLPAGRHKIVKCRLPQAASQALAASLKQIRPAEPPTPKAIGPDSAGAAPPMSPEWALALDGQVSRLAYSSQTSPKTVWAVVGGKLLVATDLDGKVLHRHTLNSPARSLWVATSQAQASEFTALVGCDDDRVHAFAADGAEKWTVQAQIAPKFKIGDRYDAPWFTDPAHKHGVLSILAGDLWSPGHEEIALGRACTVELRDLKGRLLKRIATQWGDNTALALVRGRERKLLVGKFFTGIPGLSVIGPTRELVSNGYCTGLPKGATSMYAWMQQGASHLAAADLNGDRADEVLVLRSGHWNELAAYDAANACLWLARFGPGPSRSRFMTSLVVADLDHDGRPEIAVGMASGWVCVFDAQGTPRWQRCFPAAVNALAAVGPHLAVGDAAGRVHVLSASGEPVALAQTKGAVLAMCSAAPAGRAAARLLVATARGEIAAFSLPERKGGH